MKRLLSLNSLLLILSCCSFAQTTDDSIKTNNAMRHEFVKRGAHEKELKLGDYVIAGIFKTEANAKHFAEELQKAGFSEAAYGYLTQKVTWYIHLAVSDDIEVAKAERGKYRKLKMFKDAWLLTVHE